MPFPVLHVPPYTQGTHATVQSTTYKAVLSCPRAQEREELRRRRQMEEEAEAARKAKKLTITIDLIGRKVGTAPDRDCACAEKQPCRCVRPAGRAGVS